MGSLYVNVAGLKLASFTWLTSLETFPENFPKSGKLMSRETVAELNYWLLMNTIALAQARSKETSVLKISWNRPKGSVMLYILIKILD